MTEKGEKNCKHCCEGVSKGDCKFDSIVGLFSFVIFIPTRIQLKHEKKKGIEVIESPKKG